jgi:hypothetical protein
MAPLTGDPKSYPLSDFKDSITGTCLCGSIKVTIADPELFTKPRGFLCHCSNCRKVAGSYCSSNIIIPEEKVTIQDTKGTRRVFEDDQTGSGTMMKRNFCGVCGK